MSDDDDKALRIKFKFYFDEAAKEYAEARSKRFGLIAGVLGLLISVMTGLVGWTFGVQGKITALEGVQNALKQTGVEDRFKATDAALLEARLNSERAKELSDRARRDAEDAERTVLATRKNVDILNADGTIEKVRDAIAKDPDLRAYVAKQVSAQAFFETGQVHVTGNVAQVIQDGFATHVNLTRDLGTKPVVVLAIAGFRGAPVPPVGQMNVLVQLKGPPTKSGFDFQFVRRAGFDAYDMDVSWIAFRGD